MPTVCKEIIQILCVNVLQSGVTANEERALLVLGVSSRSLFTLKPFAVAVAVWSYLDLRLLDLGDFDSRLLMSNLDPLLPQGLHILEQEIGIALTSTTARYLMEFSWLYG